MINFKTRKLPIREKLIQKFIICFVFHSLMTAIFHRFGMNKRMKKLEFFSCMMQHSFHLLPKKSKWQWGVGERTRIAIIFVKNSYLNRSYYSCVYSVFLMQGNTWWRWYQQKVLMTIYSRKLFFCNSRKTYF